MMNIIKAVTKRGLELRGAIYGEEHNGTVLVMIPGISSNVFQNDLLDTTGRLMAKNGMATIIGHAYDSFSCFAYTDHSTGKQKFTGVFDGVFAAAYEDVETWVLKAREIGYKKIILGGHSLGSNKIINYLGNTDDDFVEYFIVSAPVDIMHWWKIMPGIETCHEIAKKFVREGRENDILPVLFGGFSPMTAKTVMDFHNADNLKNCPVLSKNGETRSLHNIKPNGAFIIGSKDSVAGDSPKEFMNKINQCTGTPALNKVIEIAGASHIFYGMHDIYAETVIGCVMDSQGRCQ